MLINESLIISNIFMYFYSNETLSAIFSFNALRDKCLYFPQIHMHSQFHVLCFKFNYSQFI